MCLLAYLHTRFELDTVLCFDMQAQDSITIQVLYRNLYLRFWFHGLFSADDRNSSRTFLLEVHQYAVFVVASPTRIRGFELWSRSFKPEHASAVFSRPTLPWSLWHGTDALLGPWWISRLDEVDQSLSPCLELLAGYVISGDTAVRGGLAEIVEMLSGLVQ